MPTGVYPRRPLKPKPNRQPKAVIRPSIHDIYWAAGVNEGEGSILQTGASVNQNDRWLVFRLQELFGGNVTMYNGGNGPIWNWSVCGSRGRGFIYTIFRLLSPRRQTQIRKAKSTEGSFLGPIKNAGSPCP